MGCFVDIKAEAIAAMITEDSIEVLSQSLISNETANVYPL